MEPDVLHEVLGQASGKRRRLWHKSHPVLGESDNLAADAADTGGNSISSAPIDLGGSSISSESIDPGGSSISRESIKWRLAQELYGKAPLWFLEEPSVAGVQLHSHAFALYRVWYGAGIAVASHQKPPLPFVGHVARDQMRETFRISSSCAGVVTPMGLFGHIRIEASCTDS